MPVTYQIDKSARLVRVICTGDVDDQQVLALYRRMRADPDYSPGFSELVDQRDVSRLDLTRAGLRSLADLSANREGPPTPFRTAIVAPSDPTFALGRMYELLSDGATPEEVSVFRDMDAALAWLGMAVEED
ncbi:MAG: hypothetical protein BIFFINMI_03365 [Phycisphaerae bacterium]|nr:hypothetical protein [Phycisphaerae bacterium]